MIDAWYTLGHLGGFNTLNMQVPPRPPPPPPFARARLCVPVHSIQPRSRLIRRTSLFRVLGRLTPAHASSCGAVRQVTEQGEGVSYMNYDVKEGVQTSEFALFHNMEEVEYKANWARFWVDMGTADEMALDILINSLMQLSREYVGIKSAIIGGINEDWKEDTEGKQGGDLLMRLGMAPARRGGTDFLDQMPSAM